jgi:surface protein
MSNRFRNNYRYMLHSDEEEGKIWADAKQPSDDSSTNGQSTEGRSNYAATIKSKQNLGGSSIEQKGDQIDKESNMRYSRRKLEEWKEWTTTSTIPGAIDVEVDFREENDESNHHIYIEDLPMETRVPPEDDTMDSESRGETALPPLGLENPADDQQWQRDAHFVQQNQQTRDLAKYSQQSNADKRKFTIDDGKVRSVIFTVAGILLLIGVIALSFYLNDRSDEGNLSMKREPTAPTFNSSTPPSLLITTHPSSSPYMSPSNTPSLTPSLTPSFPAGSFGSSSELRSALDSYLVNDGQDTVHAQRYGWPIGAWDVARIKDFRELFSVNRNPDVVEFDQNLSTWDTSSATDMSGMFRGAASFDKDISSWDVSRVKTMRGMFRDALAFNQGVSTWDLSKVETMREMFRDARSFNQDLSTWRATNVEDLSFLFFGASSFNADISTWDVAKAETMQAMFSRAVAFNHTLGSWNTSRVTDMSYLFFEASSFNQDISGWDTSSATNLSYTFSRASLFDQDLSSWDVSNVETLKSTFSSAVAFNHTLGSWNTSRVADMSYLFFAASSFNQELSRWDVSNVETMHTMFYQAVEFGQSLENWVTSSVKDMSFMFRGAQSFNGDISAWDVSKVSTMFATFAGATLFDQDVSSWNTSKVEDMSGMFWGASSLDQDLSSWDVSAVLNLEEMFAEASAFNHSLCAWGDSLSGNASVAGMFTNTPLCLIQTDPYLTANPPGPFCHPCSWL